MVPETQERPPGCVSPGEELGVVVVTLVFQL